MSDANEEDKRTITIKRIFNAPIKLVWKAWTKPEHIANWWGPKGMEVNVIEHDFRVGGKWKYTMAMVNGMDFISEGEYLVIVELEKVFSSANFRPMTEGVEIQALFYEDGDKTNFTFNVIHPTEEYCKQQEKMGIYNGWGSVFDGLGNYVTNLEE